MTGGRSRNVLFWRSAEALILFFDLVITRVETFRFHGCGRLGSWLFMLSLLREMTMGH